MDKTEQDRWQWARNAARVIDALDGRSTPEAGKRALEAILEDLKAMQKALNAHQAPKG